MSLDLALLPRLRRTGVGVLAGWRIGAPLVERWRGAGVPVAEHLTTFGAAAWARGHPHAPLVVVDRFSLDVALDLVVTLERTMARRPVVIVVAPSLHEGLAELGWTRSTDRVGFARVDTLHDDVDDALRTLLAAEPAPPDDSPPPPRDDVARRAAGLSERDAAAALTALQPAIADAPALAWAAPLVERRGDALVVQARLAEAPDLGATLTLRVAGTRRDPGAWRFSLALLAALAPAPAFFAAHGDRGLRDAFAQLRDVKLGDAGFDDAFVVRADDGGLEEARAEAALVARLGGELRDEAALEWNDGALVSRGTALALDGVVRATDAALALWRALVRRRLGA